MRGLLSDISGHLKKKNVSKSRQHGLTNGNSCLSKAVVTVRKALLFPVTMEAGKSDVSIVRAAAAFLCCSRLCGSDAGLLDRYPQTALIICLASPFILFSLFPPLQSYSLTNLIHSLAKSQPLFTISPLALHFLTLHPPFLFLRWLSRCFLP